MSARKGIAPCGHPGTHVTNTMITCDLRCEFGAEKSDGVPAHVDPERTQVICRFCGHDECVPWEASFNDSAGRTYWMCRKCVRSFHA